MFPQSNGMAERSVQTVKHLIHSSQDPYTALLAYCTTPLENGFSSAQLLYSQQLHSNLPATVEQLRRKVRDPVLLAQWEALQNQPQKSNFDVCHHTKELPSLPLRSSLFILDRQEAGHVMKQPRCRSYIVSTPSGKFQQNKCHINQLSDSPPIITEAYTVVLIQALSQRPISLKKLLNLLLHPHQEQTPVTAISITRNLQRIHESLPK